MTKRIFAALLLAGTALGTAQAQETAPAAPAAPAAAAPASALSQQQITAFNQAVKDFTAGQQAQQGGDNAGAIAKYDAALPAVRAAAQAEPNNVDYAGFLGNLLYAKAAAHAASGSVDAVIPLYQEAVPQWKKVVAAKPQDATSRDVLAGLQIQLGNAALAKQDKATAGPLYEEATVLARQSASAAPTDAAAQNLLLGALIGRSQTSADKAAADEATALSKKMIADGTVDAANKPAAQALAGAPAQAN